MTLERKIISNGISELLNMITKFNNDLLKAEEDFNGF